MFTANLLLYSSVSENNRMYKVLYFAFGMLQTCFINGQSFDGKSLYWSFETEKSDSVEIQFKSNGVNIGGAEATSAIIKNKSGQSITIELLVTLVDNCGSSFTRSFSVPVKPNATVGGNTWMGGMEQMDFMTQCKNRKEYNQHFKSVINDVDLEVVKIWRGSEAIRRTAPVKYMGTEVEYIKGKGATIIAKIKSTNKNVITVLTYLTREGKELAVVEVLPYGTSVQKVNCSDCLVEMTFKPYKVPSENVLDLVKQKVRGVITTKPNGEVNFEAAKGSPGRRE